MVSLPQLSLLWLVFPCRCGCASCRPLSSCGFPLEVSSCLLSPSASASCCGLGLRNSVGFPSGPFSVLEFGHFSLQTCFPVSCTHLSLFFHIVCKPFRSLPSSFELPLLVVGLCLWSCPFAMGSFFVGKLSSAFFRPLYPLLLPAFWCLRSLSIVCLGFLFGCSLSTEIR